MNHFKGIVATVVTPIGVSVAWLPAGTIASHTIPSVGSILMSNDGTNQMGFFRPEALP